MCWSPNRLTSSLTCSLTKADPSEGRKSATQLWVKQCHLHHPPNQQNRSQMGCSLLFYSHWLNIMAISSGNVTHLRKKRQIETLWPWEGRCFSARLSQNSCRVSEFLPWVHQPSVLQFLSHESAPHLAESAEASEFSQCFTRIRKRDWRFQHVSSHLQTSPGYSWLFMAYLKRFETIGPRPTGCDFPAVVEVHANRKCHSTCTNNARMSTYSLMHR